MNKEALRRYLKQGDWLGRPKWVTDPNWTTDEAAVNDWYEAIDDEMNDAGSRALPATMKAWEMRNSDPQKYLDLTSKYNLYLNRHNRTSMNLLNRARDILTDKAYNQYSKADRNLALSALEGDLDYLLTRTNQTDKLTPKGKALRNLHRDVSAYIDRPVEEQNKEPIPKDIAAQYKATPYQLKHWRELANTDIGKAKRRNALIGAGIGGGLGALTGLGLSFIPANEYTIGGKITGRTDTGSVPLSVRLALAGATGGVGALMGGTVGYIGADKKLRNRKQYALKRLSEYE